MAPRAPDTMWEGPTNVQRNRGRRFGDMRGGSRGREGGKGCDERLRRAHATPVVEGAPWKGRRDGSDTFGTFLGDRAGCVVRGRAGCVDSDIVKRIVIQSEFREMKEA
jgi:hypothetical protein